MATKNKTTETGADINEFLFNYVDNELKRNDSLQLIELMSKWSGSKPRLWGPNIIGFGNYHYKYASGREGDSPYFAFSPRKAAFSLYVVVPGYDYQGLLGQLGKYKMGKYCIYFKKLSDLNPHTLESICKYTIKIVSEKQGC